RIKETCTMSKFLLDKLRLIESACQPRRTTKDVRAFDYSLKAHAIYGGMGFFALAVLWLIQIAYNRE
ncbi:hypothetical protein, partial [Shouchella clausii]